MGSGEAKEGRRKNPDLTQRPQRSARRVRREAWGKLREANREIGVPGHQLEEGEFYG